MDTTEMSRLTTRKVTTLTLEIVILVSNLYPLTDWGLRVESRRFTPINNIKYLFNEV